MLSKVKYIVFECQYLHSLKNMASNEDNCAAFIQAARDGDVTAVKALLSTGVGVNYCGESVYSDNNTPPALVLAAEIGHLSVVEYLLEQNADVDNKVEFSALYLAARQGNVEIVRRLVAAGAKSEFSYIMGTANVLPACAEQRPFTNTHLEIVKLLISNHYDVDSEDENGHTALMNAIYENNHELFDLLINEGANVNARIRSSYKMESVLDQAAHYGRFEMVQTLLSRGADFNHPTKGYTPLHKAVIRNKLDVMKLFLDIGCVAEALESARWTALHEAARYGTLEAIKILLDSGFQIEARTATEGMTPLLEAACSCRRKAVELLLDAGANINAQDSGGQTALHHATCFINSYDYITRTKEKTTYHQVEVVKLLLSHGADLSIADLNGITALPKAITCLDLDDDVEHTIAGAIGAAPRGDIEAVELLISHGASIHVQDLKGGTALHRAAHEWNIELIQILIKAGADLEAKKLDGSTPLFEAISLMTGDHDSKSGPFRRMFWWYSDLAIGVLLDAGADIHARLNNQRTLLHQVVQNLDETHNLENKSNGKIILLLLSRGVDVAAKDHNGDTAEQLAVKLGRQEIAEFLDESSREI